jgi:hypothetical protein
MVATSFTEKLWPDQLILHLREFASLERHTGNKAYVV